MKTRHGLADWGLLLALMVLWGSAFLLTKVAVDTIPSQLLVAGRLAIAALLLVPSALMAGRGVPSGRRLWLFLVLIALFGNALPFSLITWGQRSVDSGLAGILMAITPLVTLILSHFLVPGERLDRFRVGGFVLGFAGIVVLMGRDALVSLVNGDGYLLPMLAILAGAACYAVAAILARLRPSSDVLSTAALTTLIAALMLSPFVVGTGATGLDEPPPAEALAAVAALGIFSTALAAILYFRLVKSAGPPFVSQLNYLIPVWAVVMGAVFLGEQPELRHYLALSLILGGVLLAQLGRWLR